MNEQKKKVGAQFAQLAKRGLLIVRLCIYLGMLVLIVWVFFKGVGSWEVGVGEAVAHTTLEPRILLWMLLGCSS